ncbi:MAG: methylenetetrahydrofolate reductase C-terminal domain-containing protein [Elusimicrobia bacterium]|nr:methylenetetrahydrofolate reductase C-terminal domain-containing protein [Elusimicrobiota bacterium]
MIITVSKPFGKILENLKPYNKIFVIGCAACATKCQTGSEEQVKNIINKLENEGKKVTGFLVLDTPCDIRIAKKDLLKSKEANASDCLLVLSCGAGVQSVEKVIEKDLIPALDPVFVGTTERIGIYHEFCAVCGECILDKTAGICPVARCSKGLVNGPCGGVIDGKCEVDLEQDCVWALIYQKLKKKGRERDLINNVFGPRKTLKPKKVVSGKG